MNDFRADVRILQLSVAPASRVNRMRVSDRRWVHLIEELSNGTSVVRLFGAKANHLVNSDMLTIPFMPWEERMMWQASDWTFIKP